MKKLMLALVAGCMSAAVAGAYAAQGSPADTDKAGRMAPGTAAGEMGAVQPTPGKAGPSTTPGSKKGSTASSSSTTGTGSSATTGTGASATTSSGGAAASSGSGMDEPKKGRRARASKG